MAKKISDKKDKKEEKKLQRFMRKASKKTKSNVKEQFDKSGKFQSGADLMGRRKERRGQGSDEGRTSEVGNAVGEKSRFKGARQKSVKKSIVDKRSQRVKPKEKVEEGSYIRKPLVEYGTFSGHGKMKEIQRTAGEVGSGKLDEAKSKGWFTAYNKAASKAAEQADTDKGKAVTQKTYSGAKPEKNTGLLRGKKDQPLTNEEKAAERAKVYTFKDKGKDKNYMKLKNGKLRNTGKSKRSKAKHVYKFASRKARKDFMDAGGEKKVREQFESDTGRKSLRAGELKKRGRRIVIKGKSEKGERPGRSGHYGARRRRR